MFTIRTLTCFAFALIALLGMALSVHAQGPIKLTTPTLPKKDAIFPPDPKKKDLTGPLKVGEATIKTMDFQVTSLVISYVSSDRYKLTATVKNASKYDHEKGGTLVFSRAGHGEPLPAKAGGKVEGKDQWGHKKLAEKPLPAIKAGQSTTLSIETNGRGDFYAHIEGVLDMKADNNRRDATNLYARPLTINDALVQLQFGSTVAKSKSRLDGSEGSFEIPGLVSKSTFKLPTEAFDQKLVLGLNAKLTIKVNDINAKSASLKLEDGALVYRLEYETNGDEVIVGGNKVADAIYPNVNTDQLKVKVKMPLKFDSRKQLFTLGTPEVTVTSNWMFNTNIPGLKEVLNSMLGSVNSTIKSSISSALSPSKVAEIEWNLNKGIRDQFLTDKFGNSGAIDSATISGDRIDMRMRAPKVRNAAEITTRFGKPSRRTRFAKFKIQSTKSEKRSTKNARHGCCFRTSYFALRTLCFLSSSNLFRLTVTVSGRIGRSWKRSPGWPIAMLETREVCCSGSAIRKTPERGRSSCSCMLHSCIRTA